jgi:hypothetical protein
MKVAIVHYWLVADARRREGDRGAVRHLSASPALEQLDLRGYDLIISSEAGPAKGIVPPSPMRYIWNMFHEYRAGSGLLTRLAMPPLAHYLRIWDCVSASRVDHSVGGSTVRRR